MTTMQPTDAWPLTEEAKELLPANPFSAQPKRPNESGSTLCEVRWLVETPAGWLGAYDTEAFEAAAKIARAPLQAEIEQRSDDLLKAQEALQRASDWLHAAYDRPPRTPDCQAMLDEIDALCGLGAEKSGWSAPHDDESN